MRSSGGYYGESPEKGGLMRSIRTAGRLTTASQGRTDLIAPSPYPQGYVGAPRKPSFVNFHMSLSPAGEGQSLFLLEHERNSTASLAQLHLLVGTRTLELALIQAHDHRWLRLLPRSCARNQAQSLLAPWAV